MIKVGGEVDAFCNKCNLLLAHTIHAVVGARPVKVECNTCHVVHAFRRPPGSSATPVKKSARGAREKPVVFSFDELLRVRNPATAQRYSPKSSFGLDQVIDHPIFGMGFVSAVRDAGKIEVTFRSDVKVLVQGKA
jgi:phage FluMu protein Com